MKDADRGGLNFESVKQVKRHSGVVGQCRLDRILMAEYCDGLLRILCPNLLEFFDHPSLNFQHQISVRGSGNRTESVESLPCGVGFEFLESLAGPVTEVNLDQTLSGPYFEVQGTCKGLRRFERALQGTAVNGANRQILKPAGKGGSLAMPAFAQPNTGCMAGQSFSNPCCVPVANQENSSQLSAYT